MSLLMPEHLNVLLVEDHLPTLESLRSLFQDDMPDATFFEATNLTAARALLSQGTYRVVVLDLMLPVTTGNAPEPDVSLCDWIDSASSPCLVIHITAYPDDTLLQLHLAAKHITPEESRADWFSKLESGWSDRLALRVRGYLYSQVIREQCDTLFGPEPYVEAVSGLRSVVTGGGHCLTFELAVLCNQVSQHWDVLDGPLQRRIQRVLHVDASVTPVRVGLA